MQTLTREQIIKVYIQDYLV